MLRKVSPRYYFKCKEVLLLFAASLCLSIFSAAAYAQTTKAGDKAEDAPCFSEYRGVAIGMSLDDARKKLGEPKEKADELDIYNFGDKESAQVYYDKKSMKVTAISVDYMGETGAPECKKVTGGDAVTRADGSKFKLVRYQKYGYWVSYNRTAGDTPMVTVTMQKIQ